MYLKPTKRRGNLAKRLATEKTETYGVVIMVVAAIGLLLWRLSSQTNGNVNAAELVTKQQLYIDSPWWKSISYLYGPYYVLLHGTYAIARNTWSLRLTSVIIGVLAIIAVYWLASSWHGYKIGLLAAGICLTSFGFLALSREATPVSSQLLLAIALVVAVDLVHRLPGFVALLVLTVFLIGALYIPGGVWLSLIALWITYKPIKTAFGELSSKLRLSVIGIGLLLLMPIANFLIRFASIAQLKTWLGYGLTDNIHAFHEFLSRFIHTPLDLFVHSYSDGTFISLGHLPVLPITYTALILIGILTYAMRFTNWRWQSVIILLAATWLLSGFGLISPLSLIPLLSVCAATGLAYMLKEWFDVFPRNHIARAVGLIVMIGVLSISGFYGIRTYIVAWSNNPQVKASYNNRLN
jgi:4-amino-4-deoxy-L-arabinose transferase-like glycosyltransferase